MYDYPSLNFFEEMNIDKISSTDQLIYLLPKNWSEL